MALTQDRTTPAYHGKEMHHYDVRASTRIFAGALVVLNAGYAAPGSAATGLVAVGRAEHYADNSAGGNGDIKVRVRSGISRWNNSAAADAIARTEIGSDCYLVDDQTVARTSASNTRSTAGKVIDVDALGVWVAIGPGGVL